MAVSTTNAISGPYTTNGATTVFPFTFTAPTADEVSVFLRDDDGNDTTVDTDDYTATLVDGGGGSVTFDTAPVSGYSLYVLLDPDFRQEIEFENGSDWLAEPVNEANDRSASRAQALKRDVDRAFKVPVGEEGLALPAASQRTGGKILGFDSDTGAAAVLAGSDFKGDPGGNVESIGLFSAARAGTLTIDSGTTSVRTSGHTVEGLGQALYSDADPITGDVPDAAFIAANPLTSFAAVDESANARYFVLAEQQPDAAQFGVVAGAPDQATVDAINALVDSGDLPARVRDLPVVAGATGATANQAALNALELWVASRSKTCTMKGQGHPILLLTPWIPQSGNSVTSDATFLNYLDPLSVANDELGETNVVKLGEFHPAYFDQSYSDPVTFYTIATPSVGYTTFNLDGGANRTAGLGALAVGETVALVTTDRFYNGSGGWERYDIVHFADVASIDSGTGDFTVDKPLDESRGSAWAVCLMNDAAVTHADALTSMFVLKDWTFTGSASWISAGDVIIRTATKDVFFGGKYWWGQTAYYGNAFQYTDAYWDFMSASHKLADVAAYSATEKLLAGIMAFRGVGSGSLTACLLNEQTRNFVVGAKLLIAPEYNVSNLIKWLNVRGSGFQFGKVIAPALATTAIATAIDTATGDETTPVCTENWLDLGDSDFDEVPRFFDITMDRFRFRRALLNGTAANASNITGANVIMGPETVVSSGAVQLGTGATGGVFNGAFAAGGFTTTGSGSLNDNSVAALSSTSWNLLRSASIDSATNTTVASTAAGTAAATMTIPAAALIARDKVRFVAEGASTGAGGTKTVTLADNTGIFATLTIPSGTQSWRIEGQMVAQSNAAIIFSGQMIVGSTSTAFGVRIAGLDLTTNGRTLTLDAYKADAGDTLTIHAHRFTPQRQGY